MKLPQLIYVSVCNDEPGENLLAWRDIANADDGKVAVYERVEVLNKRDVAEVRRPGTKAWFKPTR